MQPKLVVGSASDPLESEADAFADRVMRMSDPSPAPAPGLVTSQAAGSVQRKCAECEKEDEKRVTVRRSATPSPASSVAPSPLVGDALRSSGSPLDGTTREFMESRSSHDFSRVRVITGATAAESAREMNARAYTVGNNIVFGDGQYQPATSAGRHLLAHELAHTVQQEGSGEGVVQRSEVDDDPRFCKGRKDLESEVDKYTNDALTKARNTAPPGFESNKSQLHNFLVDARQNTSAIENWLENHSDAYKQSGHTDTKYEGVVPGPAPGRLGSTVLVAGNCVGSDKFGHFFDDGFAAYKAVSQEEAEKDSADKEIGSQGLAATGVYSRADILANMAGREFYTKLHGNPKLNFAIRGYIKPEWNEQVTTSFYAKGVAETVWKNYLRQGPWKGLTLPHGGARAAIELQFTDVDMAKMTVKGQYFENAIPDGSDPWNQTNTRPRQSDFTGTVSFRTAHVQGHDKDKADPVSGIELNIDITSGSSVDISGWFISVGEKTLDGRWGRQKGKTDGTWGVKRP